MATRSKAWVCGRPLAGNEGLNPAGGTDVCYECLCPKVEVSFTGRSLIQRSSTECVCVCARVSH